MSAARLYWENKLGFFTPKGVKLPVAASAFPDELFQAPIDVLSGRALGAEAGSVLAVQLGWLVAVALLGRLVLARATRRLVVQGG